MDRKVVFLARAGRDLRDIHDFIMMEGGTARAAGYVERIERFCSSLAIFPERGTRLDHVRPGLRMIGFERRVAIMFTVRPEAVTILRVLYGGRDLGRALGET